MPKFTDYKIVTQLLEKAQEADKDMREKVREVKNFLSKPNGQWEENVYNTFAGRPRYTFDRCNDIVDDIAGEIEQANFAIKIVPAGGDANKDLAKTRDGLIRNIENLSNAQDIFNAAARSVVASGMDGWEITHRWGDNDTFDQDLFIDPISNFVDRVWYDPLAELATKEDAEYCFKLQSMAKEGYEEKFPKGSGKSLNSDRTTDSDFSFGKPEVITVGKIFYKKNEPRRIVEMTNGQVFVDDDKYAKIRDELEEKGVTEKRSREKDHITVKTRLFDGDDWLGEEQDTVFSFLPIIPEYANFEISDNQDVYWGIVSKKMDAQRVYNYTESRKVEEGALAPLEKIVVTADQVGPYKDSWANLNTSSDPALLYEHQEGQPPPHKIGGAQVNQGLEAVSMSARENLQSTSGLDQIANQPVGVQSGVAVELKQNKGDTRNYKYTVGHQRAICHTGKVLNDAIPKVYDTERQVRILGEDGSFDIVTVNHQEFDTETKQMVKVRDLSRGTYDVTCDVGPAFKNRQRETVAAFTEIAQVDPSLLELGKDVYFKAMSGPGWDKVAERARQQLLVNGVITESQMTDEEKQFMEAQGQQEDPVAAAIKEEAEANTADIQSKIEERDDKLELAGAAQVLKEQEFEHKKQQDSMAEALKTIQVAAAELKSNATALREIREALAPAVGEGQQAPDITDPVFEDQKRVIRDSQAEQRELS